MAQHASPNCACGTNEAGQRYVDPICAPIVRAVPATPSVSGEDTAGSGQLDLDAIAARANAATPGPWYWSKYGLRTDSSPTLTWVLDERDEELDPFDQDAEFIAHAREDIPALLAELAEYRIDLGEICHHYDRPCGCPNSPDPAQAYMVMREARDALRAQLAEVTRERDQARADRTAEIIAALNAWADRVLQEPDGQPLRVGSTLAREFADMIEKGEI